MECRLLVYSHQCSSTLYYLILGVVLQHIRHGVPLPLPLLGGALVALAAIVPVGVEPQVVAVARGAAAAAEAHVGDVVDLVDGD